MTKLKDSPTTGPKDVFLHLLAIVWLYVSVIAFGTLLFQLINVYFPDLRYESIMRAREMLRVPLSMLVIVFPFYVWLSSFLQKDLEKNPKKRELKIRKWLLYFTLFATTIVIVIDLIVLIYHFLGGGLTTPFILKVFSVLLVAASVFTYYIWNLRKDIPASKDPKMKYFVRGVVGVAGLAIIFGFFAAGSPQAERMRQDDERRVSDLQRLQYEITNYWQAKDVLPEDLDNLRNELRGFIPPVDPETDESYEYQIVGDLSFELCANFKTSNEAQKGAVKSIRTPYYDSLEGNVWLHNAERTCFSRTIDPDLYPLYEKRPMPLAR